jgi:hypothetical protein
MANFPHNRIQPRYVPKDVIVVEVMGEGFYDRCRVRDVSISGVSIFVPHSFEGCNIDTALDMFFTMPDKQSFKAKGLLRHLGISGRPYFGIKILSFDGLGQEIWSNYVKRYED